MNIQSRGSNQLGADRLDGMVEALSHITFIVRDLDRMQVFLESVFGATEIYTSGDRTFSVSREKFLLIGGTWVAIMEGEPLTERSYNHVAFKIRDDDYDVFAGRLRKLGIEMREGRSRVAGEGRSLYFHDYDNHLFELHTGTLYERLMRYRQGL